MAVNLLPPMPATDSEMVLQLFRYFSRPHPRACHKVARMGGGMVSAGRRNDDYTVRWNREHGSAEWWTRLGGIVSTRTEK